MYLLDTCTLTFSVVGTAVVRLRFQSSTDLRNHSPTNVVPTVGSRLELQSDDCGSDSGTDAGTVVDRPRFRYLGNTGTVVGRLRFQCLTHHRNRGRTTAVPLPDPPSELQSDNRGSNHWFKAGTVVGQLRFQCPTHHRNRSRTTAVPLPDLPSELQSSDCSSNSRLEP